MLDLPADTGTASCTACGRGRGGERPACSDACASSAASPSPWMPRLPAAAVGYHPNQAPPAPWGCWRLHPRSRWCCCRTAKAPAQKMKQEKQDEINKEKTWALEEAEQYLYLRLKAEGVRAKLRDAVVLQENALWVVGDPSWNYGDVLRLAADRHGRRVTHTQPGACSHPAWLHHHQPQNQPQTQSTCTWREDVAIGNKRIKTAAAAWGPIAAVIESFQQRTVMCLPMLGFIFHLIASQKTHSCTSCLLPYILCVFSRLVNSGFTDWFKTIIKNNTWQRTSTMRGSKLTWCPLAIILAEEGSFFITGQRETGNRTDPFQFPIITAGTFLHVSHNSTQTRPPRERHQHSYVMKFPFISFTQDFPAAHLLTFNKLDN